MSHDSSVEKIQHKLRDMMGPHPILWKGLEDIKQTGPKETVSVPTEKYIILVEQSVLLLGQVSYTIIYGGWLNILKPLITDPKKAKHILKEKTCLLLKR